jgi:hypothetical protein
MAVKPKGDAKCVALYKTLKKTIKKSRGRIAPVSRHRFGFVLIKGLKTVQKVKIAHEQLINKQGQIVRGRIAPVS